MSEHGGSTSQSRWQKATKHPRWGRPLELAVTSIVIAGAAFGVLLALVVAFFGLIYGW